jgi:dTDP-4-amino-4,6-dideoxygalactose transaminase
MTDTRSLRQAGDAPARGRRRLREEIVAIEEFFRRRYGREALYLPSGRLGLYVAFREWLSPGDRLLMSPLTDDVVFFTVLAAGLVPVFGPIDPRTGNLDPEAIGDATWSSLHGVMTTNLYGTPDRMDRLEERCRRHRLVLLEDAAHAFDSRFEGRPVGTFGTAAVYSFSKHLEVPGGILAFPDASRRESLRRRARQEQRDRPGLSVRARRWLAWLETLKGSRPAPVWLPRPVAALLSVWEDRSGHRMAYTKEAVREAQAGGGGLDSFDRWVRMDHIAYRTTPLRAVLRTSLRRLETFEANRRRRIDGAHRLLELGLTPAHLSVPRDMALLRVPLFVAERERAIAHLARHGLTTEYVYDPPLDLYAPGLSEGLPSPPSARIWSRDVLPVHPFQAERFVALFREEPGLYRLPRETL